MALLFWLHRYRLSLLLKNTSTTRQALDKAGRFRDSVSGSFLLASWLAVWKTTRITSASSE